MTKKAKAIMVDIEKCLACKNCEIACAVAHSQSGVLEQAVNESPKPQGRVSVEAAGDSAVPMQCRHCQDAPCVAICPSGAISRQDSAGPVLIDKDKCIGCLFCVMVCPFGVLELSNNGKAVLKCDLCIARTKAGEEPACVACCPTGALEYAEVETWLKKHRQTAAARAAAELNR